MSDTFVIEGGRALRGTVRVRGSKNAATKMMVASLLTDEQCTIENVPHISDIDVTKELIERVGGTAVFADTHVLHVATKNVTSSCVLELSRRNRIPILALGPLLHRTGEAEIPVPGGCPIGHRPVQLHFDALKKMGAEVERRPHSYYARAKRLFGADIVLSYPSVGATENILFTAALAEGVTTISNAAIEPEIQNSVDMLIAMGARITVDRERRIYRIEGVSRMRGVVCSVMPDRNEIISFAVAAITTGGDIFIENIVENDITSFLRVLDTIGIEYVIQNSGIRFCAGSSKYRPVQIVTAPHPSFMTDWQQPFAVLLTQCSGVSTIHETVYEERLGYLADLQRMGANIAISDECIGDACRFHGQGYLHSARISGPTNLSCANISVKDLRAGIAHVIAALVASGRSIITGIEHIDRGYEDIDVRLRALGAHIMRGSNFE